MDGLADRQIGLEEHVMFEVLHIPDLHRITRRRRVREANAAVTQAGKVLRAIRAAKADPKLVRSWI
jgi:hypothetical protein